MTQRIYLDYNATTPTDMDLAKTWLEKQSLYANPSSIHQDGREAKELLESSRTIIAEQLSCQPEQLIFTSSATEGNNMVMRSLLDHHDVKNCHIISSKLEHASVKENCIYLEQKGVSVSWIPGQQDGTIDVTALKKAINKNTKLITIMLANNETGVIQPLEEIIRIAKQHKIKILCDAVQALGKVPIKVPDYDVDYMTFSGHKLYIPKGIGVLYVKDDNAITPLIHGGGHERRLRAGTENTAGVYTFAQGLKKANKTLDKEIKRQTKLKHLLIEKLKQLHPKVYFNGDLEHSLPNTLNCSFEGIDGHGLAINLDLEGVCISTGSACSTGSIEPSAALLSMGIPLNQVKGAIRISFGKHTTEKEITRFCTILENILNRMAKT